MSTPGPLTLYHARGSCSLAPLLVLEVCRARYLLEPVSLAEDRSWYRKVNPSGRVPALRIGGRLLTENIAILFRLAGEFLEYRLLPACIDDQAQAVSIMGWLGSHVHIARRRLRAPHHFSADAQIQARISDEARPVVLASLGRMDEIVRDRKWFTGDRFGVVDCYALVFASWAVRDGFDLSNFKGLSAWTARMCEMPAILALLEHEADPLPSAIDASGPRSGR